MKFKANYFKLMCSYWLTKKGGNWIQKLNKNSILRYFIHDLKGMLQGEKNLSVLFIVWGASGTKKREDQCKTTIQKYKNNKQNYRQFKTYLDVYALLAYLFLCEGNLIEFLWLDKFVWINKKVCIIISRSIKFIIKPKKNSSYLLLN